ncbi:ligase-associated DNA damage response endonuclease PdeM [Ruegeria sp. WL0004]|uniref:Ligase-associated DNA damage response endonuclease PdeM n=1 Tax=Ruegeria marisflavi TaxID=2984152 RepID=A0ABT2WRW3_9RHOB|nr:ligase-associated DNA damage response endonuclease PdeM [Ruegeria sp. WL0004]MCU9838402.1 ligase-associated DNA damage response endonuclease PdeM [Ruegeria sp. WL0004]
MNGYDFTFAGERLTALGTGALWWGARRLLCVSDLHLGKSERIARRGGTPLPPYEVADTLDRFAADLERTAPETVICLGDSFDDTEAARALPEPARLRIATLQAGLRWIWIEGNHDPSPVAMGGSHLAELTLGPLLFRHIAQPGAQGEISGHYHPKAALRLRGRSLSRPAFLVDTARIVLPAYGTYTGGLRSDAPVLAQLMRPEALAIVTGATPHAVPMPR